MALDNLQFWIGLAIAAITLFVLVKTNLFLPAYRLMAGSKLKIVENRISDGCYDIILKNNKKSSIVISNVRLNIQQLIFHGQTAPSKYQIEPSEQLYFIIGKTDKQLDSQTQLVVPPDGVERIKIKINTDSYETRFLIVNFSFFNGSRITAQTKSFLDFSDESTEEHLKKIASLEQNQKLMNNLLKKKLPKTERAKEALRKLSIKK
mgnify:CR=1 FL=1